MAQIFNRWFEYSLEQKMKWKRMVRFRYLLGRMKLNRIVLAWKVQIRKTKVQRLQYTIGSHAHYKRVLGECFQGMHTVTQQQRQFRERV